MSRPRAAAGTNDYLAGPLVAPPDTPRDKGSREPRPFNRRRIRAGFAARLGLRP
jgi:hypothetical protein